MKSKICGISDLKTLKFLTQYPNPPQFIGFIVNYPKSRRYVDIRKLKKLLKIKKKKSFYVAVLVKPGQKVLDEIKHLNFDYYQIYDCEPNQIEKIKKKYGKKIITALTIQTLDDVKKYNLYHHVTDIYLFDSKGYEKSISFNHSLLNYVKTDKEIMLAGNIQIDHDLNKYKKIADILDISGGVETSGFKDISKIKVFLNKIKEINNEA